MFILVALGFCWVPPEALGPPFCPPLALGISFLSQVFLVCCRRHLLPQQTQVEVFINDELLILIHFDFQLHCLAVHLCRFPLA